MLPDDGRYQTVGRSGEAIISSGENAHPAETENFVAAFAGVAGCAVVGLPHACWGEVQAPVPVTRPGWRVDEAALQALLGERPARFKHPRRIVVVEALPKTALGKVQRAGLAAKLLHIS